MVGLGLFSGLAEAGGGLKVSLSSSSEKDGECPFCASPESAERGRACRSLLVWVWVGEGDARGPVAGSAPSDVGEQASAPVLGGLRCSGT